MGKIKNLNGKSFGRLTILHIDPIRRNGKTWWFAKCKCDGNIKSYRGTRLTSGTTKSCGCLQKEIAKEKMNKHNMSNTKPYNSWCAMKKRCNSINRKNYKDYGGRGIIYDERWNSFQLFWEDMSDTYKDGLQIDRINVNGNYCKNNCRWITAKQNCNNKRNNHKLTYNGKTHTISEWAHILKINKNTLYSRARKNGWNTNKILSKNNFRENYITYCGETLHTAEWAKKTGIKRQTLYSRIKRGWDIKSALTKGGELNE